MCPTETLYWSKSRAICSKHQAKILPCSNSCYRSTNSSPYPSLYPSDRALVLHRRRANNQFKRRLWQIRRHGSTYHRLQTTHHHQAHSCQNRQVRNHLNSPYNAIARALDKRWSFCHLERPSLRTCSLKCRECSRRARGLVEAMVNQWCKQR